MADDLHFILQQERSDGKNAAPSRHVERFALFVADRVAAGGTRITRTDGDVSSLGVYAGLATHWGGPEIDQHLPLALDYHYSHTDDDGEGEIPPFKWCPYDAIPFEVIAVAAHHTRMGVPLSPVFERMVMALAGLWRLQSSTRLSIRAAKRCLCPTTECPMRNATAIVSFLDMDAPDVAILPQLAVFFLEYDPRKWRAGAGDAMFVCEGDAGVSSLYLIDDGTSTISIRYNHRKKGDRRGVEFYSLGDVALINNVVDVGDDQYVPRGSLVDPAVAWQVLNEYVESPHELPKRIAWIPSDQIEWPAEW